MKKILTVCICFILLFCGSVFASEIETFERNSSNRYGIPKRFEMGQKQIDAALKTPYVNSEELVYDFAELFTLEETEKLKETAQKISKKENYKIVIVTVPNLGRKSPMAYADDFFDYNDFGKDGILLLISIGSRDVYISTSGEGQLLFDNDRVENAIDYITPSLSSGFYGTGARKFLSTVENAFKNGISDKMSLCTIVDDLGNYTCKKPLPITFIILGSVVVSFLTVFFMTKKYKRIKKATDAQNYLNREEKDLYENQDTLINTRTTRTYISSSSSGSGGGSSHSGSSGASHGGGGGKF